MFAIPGIVLLIFSIYVRPQQLFEPLYDSPLLYVALGVTLCGIFVDLVTRRARPIAAPQLAWVFLYLCWCVVTVVVSGGVLIAPIEILLFIVIAHGIQSLRSFQWVAALLVGIVVFLAYIGIAQGLAPRGCFLRDTSVPLGAVFDGRECEVTLDCQQNGGEPGGDYSCDKVGPLGTSAVSERVRYIGVLQDPNELALAMAIGLPFVVAFLVRRRSLPRLLLLLSCIVLVGWATVYTRSRGGQLVLVTVFAYYFVNRYGIRGLLLGGILAVPVLLLGGREGAEANQSSLDRLEAMYVAVDLFRSFPVFGIGQWRFTDYHYLTAHNAYLLAAAELGFPGFFLWSGVLYTSVKVPISALRHFADDPRAEGAKAWAHALLASQCGLLLGIFFLSFTYHYVLWIFLGLDGALFLSLSRHDPGWRVRLTLRDLMLLFGLDSALLFSLFVYTRLHAP
jgi:hypothetical protein